MLFLYVLFFSFGIIFFFRFFHKSRNHIDAMSTPEHSQISYAEDFELSSPEGSEFSSYEGSETSSSEESEVKCSCGLLARLRVSHTSKNPYRLFYNCPQSYSSQCEFFRWADEPELSGDRHVEELNIIRDECTRLHGRMDEIEQRHNDDRQAWERERTELIAELMSMQNELMEIKHRIRVVNESDLMPPVDKSSSAEDEGDDAIVIYTI